jgi:TonB family protein
MTKAKNILASVLLFISGSALASSALYEVEVTGLQGLSLYEGATVWQPTPFYPRLALRRGLEGQVLVEYSINDQGKAENIRILAASPRGFFNNATIRALENARFGVAYSEGEPVRVDGVKKRFVYEIDRQAGIEPRNHLASTEGI